jgi:anti-sigma regulatory factor (Ser/Thr protein kinase)
MRAFLREVCQEGRQKEPVNEDLMGRLALAVTEAASNIILHSDQGQHKPITLTVELDEERVCATLRHTGKPFDPEAVAAPVFDGSQESGFGLYLIRQSVDEMEYGQDGDGRCRMRLVLNRRHHDKGEGHATGG